MSKKPKSHLVGRSAVNGRLMPVEKARGRADAVVERMPNPGHGDTGRGKGKGKGKK
jgi:hypothetical protein